LTERFKTSTMLAPALSVTQRVAFFYIRLLCNPTRLRTSIYTDDYWLL